MQVAEHNKAFPQEAPLLEHVVAYACHGDLFGLLVAYEDLGLYSIVV